MRDSVVRHRTPLWKSVLLGLVAVALVAGLVAGVLALNWRENRVRPMYHDVFVMAGLQHGLLESGREGAALSVDTGSAPVLVAGEPFTPQPGVTVVVEERGDAYCVKGSNEHGDETDWVCVDGTGEPPDLGALEGEF